MHGRLRVAMSCSLQFRGHNCVKLRAVICIIRAKWNLGKQNSNVKRILRPLNRQFVRKIFNFVFSLPTKRKKPFRLRGLRLKCAGRSRIIQECLNIFSIYDREPLFSFSKYVGALWVFADRSSCNKICNKLRLCRH